MSTAISIENVSKSYHLGVISSGTLREDLQSWWHRVRGLPDPNRRIDQMHQAVEGHTLWALQDVSLEIQQGDVWGIIGRNGAGKSTLLKILSRVTAPTSGRIRVRGRVASLLEVGTGFHPELTGRENIFLNGAILGMTKAEVARKLDEIVAFSEIEPFIDTPVKRYSSGMYVRLAFAVAAHLEPEILVVDEVLAVGDHAFQKKCLGKMQDIGEVGRTVLFVSHNMGAVKGLTKKAVWLDKGQVRELGDKDAIVRAYLSSNSFESAHDIRTKGIARKPGVGEWARIARIRCNEGGNVEYGGDLAIRLDVDCGMAADGVAVGIGLCNMEGARILSWDSDVAGQIFHLEPGMVCFELKVPHVELQPSSYIMDVALRSGNHYLDYLAGCLHLQVMPGPDTPAIIVRGDGQLRPVARWNLCEESEDGIT